MWREECGSSGVAAAADGSSWVEPAGDDQSEGRAACSRAAAIRVAAPAVTEDERLTASTR